MCIVAIGVRDDVTRAKLHEKIIKPFLYYNTQETQPTGNNELIIDGNGAKFVDFEVEKWRDQVFELKDESDGDDFFRYLINNSNIILKLGEWNVVHLSGRSN